MSEAVRETSAEQRDVELDPADAFALLGNEHRIRILEALWIARESPIPFTELYRETEIDDSAHFNYHLEKLTGHFVRQTDGGYALLAPGEKVVRAVLAGSLNRRLHRSIEIDDPCIDCGEPLVASYGEGRLRIACSRCESGHGEYAFPPGGLNDRTDAEVLAAFDQRVRHLHCLAKDGVCHECNGRMRTRIARDDHCCLNSSIHVEHVCQQCAHSMCSTIGLGLLDQSPVVTFFGDHGIDLARTPYWQLPWCVSDDAVTVLAADPWRFEARIELDGEQLRITLDETLSVVETTRTN